MTETYVSTSTHAAGRRWRVIHRGMPLCCDQPSVFDALAVYREFVPDPPVEVPLWDGDRGTWDTIEEVQQ